MSPVPADPGDTEVEVLPDGSTMETLYESVRVVIIRRRVDTVELRGDVRYLTGSRIAWGQAFDPGPNGPDALDSPVRRCKRNMRANPAAFDRWHR